MSQANTPQTDFWILVGIVAVLVLFRLLVGLFMFIDDFTMELKHLNVEIVRNTGAECEYWLRRRRRLWLSLIPFIKY